MGKVVKITRTESYFPGLKSRIRIITLSDLHFNKGMKVEKIRATLNLVSTMNPNYIFWLGNNLDGTNVLESSSKKEEFLDICMKSGEIATTAISLADYDMRYQVGKHIVEDLQKVFWEEVSSMPNVHVLDNSVYEDDIVRVVGYTMPNYYYHGSYLLPKDSICSSNREDENPWVLIENIKRHPELFEIRGDKINELLFPSSHNLDNGIIQSLLSCFHHVYSGNMHEGLAQELFPKNEKGVFQTQYGTICIINGGITKIAGSKKAILKPLNTFLPIHIDVIDIQNGSKVKKYKREYSYQRLD